MKHNHLIRILKIPSVILATGFLIFGFVCVGMLNHDSMRKPVNVVALMSADSQQECCNTSISKYVESWKSSLLILPREVKDGLLLLLLGLATVFAFVSLRWRYNPDDFHWLSYRFYPRDNPEFTIFNQLKLAFARGILNPKIY